MACLNSSAKLDLSCQLKDFSSASLKSRGWNEQSCSEIGWFLSSRLSALFGRYSLMLEHTAGIGGGTPRLPPLIEELISSCSFRASQYLSEIISTLAPDALGLDRNPQIFIGDADLHEGSKFVFSFQSGASRHVYKPRASSLECLIGDCLRQFEVPVFVPEIIYSNHSGYLQHYVQETQDRALPSGAREIGRFVGLAQVLGGTDLHKTNLLRSGDRFYLVDGETFFQPAGSMSHVVITSTGKLPVGRTPLFTGLLPIWRRGIDGQLSCDGGLVRAMSSEWTKNNGWREFLEELVAGYRDFFLSASSLDNVMDVVGRSLVVRRRLIQMPTRYYVAMASEVSGACLYQSCSVFERELYAAFSSSNRPAAAEEAAALSQADIPLFTDEISGGYRRKFVSNAFKTCLEDVSLNSDVVRESFNSLAWPERRVIAALSDRRYDMAVP